MRISKRFQILYYIGYLDYRPMLLANYVLSSRDPVSLYSLELLMLRVLFIGDQSDGSIPHASRDRESFRDESKPIISEVSYVVDILIDCNQEIYLPTEEVEKLGVDLYSDRIAAQGPAALLGDRVMSSL
jgi:hypothetical protein